MSKESIKKRVLEVIDACAGEIIEIGETIWGKPELGFKEWKTAELTERKYGEMGWAYESKIGITGSKAYLKKKGRGPVIGVIGELDAIRVPDHPECDPITGAAHSCGHNAQRAAMLGLMGIHAQRETFKDEDNIRVHPIITKGGEIVNNVPADVRMESYVRGKTVEAIKDANVEGEQGSEGGGDGGGG